MLWDNKKGEGTPWAVIFALVLGLIFLAFYIGYLVQAQSNGLDAETLTQTGCWLTNSVKCTGGLFSAMPTLCSLETLEEQVDKAKLADLTRDTWWMYKEGTCDLGNIGDEVYPVYAFDLKQDLFVGDYFQYILQNNRGTPVQDHVENSDYAYLETNTEEQTICFDKSDYEGQTSKFILEAEQGPYYILYYDDQGPEDDGGDKILITRNPSFDAGLWKSYGLRTGAVVVTAAAIAALPVAGAGVVIYTGGGLSWSALAAGTSLAAEAIGGTTIAIVGLGTAGGTAATFYLTADSDDTECLVYNLYGGSPDVE